MTELERIQNRVLSCTRCPLHKGCKRPVPGKGPTDPAAVLIGEAPGYFEDKKGEPFVGNAGKELDNYLSRFTKANRDLFYVTNVVKCRPPNNRTPTAEEIEACLPHLMDELFAIEPHVIGLLGGTAATALLGDSVDLEMDHGIPCPPPPVTAYGDVTLLPLYHPAAGMHETRYMTQLQEDFTVLGRVLRGEEVSIPQDQWVGPRYELLSGNRQGRRKLQGILTANPSPIAIDTETLGRNYNPWCLSFSVEEGTGYVIRSDRGELLDILAVHVQVKGVETVLHNALFDLPILEKMGIRPVKPLDTMIAAYLLQDLPQGLKPLAYRIAGMEMEDYSSTVRVSSQDKALAYFKAALEWEWPDPDPELYFTPEGEEKVKCPQNICKKMRRALNDYEKDNQVNLLDRWVNYSQDERDLIEAILGPLDGGNLSDLPLSQAVRYAARDADATLRIWPFLKSRLEDADLLRIFELNLSILPMVKTMQERGFKVNTKYLTQLSDQFQDRMDSEDREIAKVAGRRVNPGSSKQVKQFLFTELNLASPLKKRSKLTGEPSSDDQVLTSMVGLHPVVTHFQEWRKFSKLKSTYTETLPRQVDKFDRVHPSIRMTRTSTGRLACANPNLQNIPTRTEEGKLIRKGFVATPGCKLVSGDYSGIEMRVAAHISQDIEMLRIFREGLDVHSQTASSIFGLPVDKIDKMKHRYPAKRVGFGVLYGITGEALYELLLSEGCTGWTPKSCEELIKHWFQLYKGIRDHFSRVKAEARRTGFVREAFYGAIRRIPEAKSALPWIREAGERQACSMVVQGAAQSIMKAAMAELVPVYEDYLHRGIACCPLIQIHDDLLFEVREDTVEEFSAIYKAVLSNVVELSIPLEVEMAVGDTWGEMKGQEDD